MAKHISILTVLIFIMGCEHSTQDNDQMTGPQRDSVYSVLKEYYSKQDYESAERTIDKLKPAGENDLAFFTYKAKIKFNRHKFSETIFAINQAISINPNNATLLFLKCSSYNALDFPDSALIFLTKAINLDSTNTGYISARVRMYESMNQPTLQYDDLRHLIRIDSNKLAYKISLYDLNLQFGDTAGTIAGYNYLLNKFPNEISLLFRLGQVALMQGKKTEAKKYFQKCIDLEPTHGEVFFYMASILSSEKKINESCNCLLKAVELGDEDAIKHIYKCDEYLRKKGIRVERTDTVYKVIERNKTTKI